MTRNGNANHSAADGLRFASPLRLDHVGQDKMEKLYVTLESEALSKALEVAKDYADTILKAPLNQVGGILADTVGYWRLKNRVRLHVEGERMVGSSSDKA